MKFIDCNSPGTIYEGDQVHADGLDWLGGFASPISDATAFKLMQTPLCESDPKPWSYRSAPAFWADNNGRPE